MDIAEILGKIGFDGKMFLFNIINFLVVLFLVRKFLFGKIVSTIDQRKEEIKTGLENAERFKSELAMAEQKSDELISAAKAKANKLVIAAEAEANVVAEGIKSEAATEAEAIIAKAHEKTRQEREQMIARIKKETADLAIMATEKIIREKLNDAKDKQLIESYLDKLEHESK